MVKIRKLVSLCLAVGLIMSATIACTQKPKEDNINGNIEYNQELLNVRLTSLWDTIKNENIAFPDDKVTVFLSLCNKLDKAKVIHSSAESLEDTWKEIEKKAYSLVKKTPLLPLWVKADVVINKGTYQTEDVKAELSQAVDYGYRLGLSLDKDLNNAYLEAECNANGIYDYISDNISEEALRTYSGQVHSIPNELTMFVTQGYFCGTDNITQKLISNQENFGVRNAILNEENIKTVIDQSIQYLLSLQHEDGSFAPGFYGHTNEPIGKTTAISHISALWAMIKGYEQSPNEKIAISIDKGINFIIHEYVRYSSNDAAYIFDPAIQEICLRDCASTLNMLIEYQHVLQSDAHKELINALGEGIFSMCDPKTGKFTESMTEDFAVIEKSEKSNYEGEAAFALCRLYQLIPDIRYINAAKSVADQFIVSGVSRMTNIWLYYTLNELTRQSNDPRYYEYVMNSVKVNLTELENKIFPSPETNEILGVAYEMLQRATDNDVDLPYLNTEYNPEHILSVMEKSLRKSFSSFGFPETIMYFSNPSKQFGAFFVRNNYFSAGTEDTMHFIFGYSRYLGSVD